MKIAQISLIAASISFSFLSSAQEDVKLPKNEVRKESRKMDISSPQSALSTEQIALKKANDLKSKVQLSNEQFESVKALFVKIENRRNAIKNTDSEENAKAKTELKSLEEQELNKILTPEQQKLRSN